MSRKTQEKKLKRAAKISKRQTRVGTCSPSFFANATLVATHLMNVLNAHESVIQVWREVTNGRTDPIAVVHSPSDKIFVNRTLVLAERSLSDFDLMVTIVEARSLATRLVVDTKEANDPPVICLFVNGRFISFGDLLSDD